MLVLGFLGGRGAWLSIWFFVFLENVRFMMVSCSFHGFLRRLVLFIFRHLPMLDFVRCGLAFGYAPLVQGFEEF